MSRIDLTWGSGSWKNELPDLMQDSSWDRLQEKDFVNESLRDETVQHIVIKLQDDSSNLSESKFED